MSMCDPQFIQQQIDIAVAQLDLYNDAINALVVQGVKSYSLNTGQTTQSVTKFDLIELQKTVDSLLNRIATLEARLKGCGTGIARPAF